MRYFLFASLLLLSLSGFTQKYYLFIGTYTSGDSKGIYVYQFDAATGAATPVSSIFTENPSYLALAPKGDRLYSVNETDGAKPGGVSAFSFDKTTGQLQFLDRQASGGDDPAYISVDARRKWVMVANYSGGNLAALPVQGDGSVAPFTQLIQHTGTGPNKDRQEKAHVHSVTFSPDEHFLIAADLGLDKLSVYQFNANAASTPLTAPLDSSVSVEPGSGPRHIAFSSGRPYVYVMTELGGAVDAFHYSNGKLTPLQHISSLPEDYKGSMGSADIHISPNGKFLYASNRGEANNIAIYSIDPASGKLSLKGFQSTQGQGPRNFMIDPTGRWLLVGNQKTNTIVTFRIDQQTGLLTQAEGQPLSIPAPVCLKMLKK